MESGPFKDVKKDFEVLKTQLFPAVWPTALPPVSTLYLDNVSVSPALVWLVVLGVLQQDLVHVSAGILEQLVGVVKDDESDLAVAQDAQLVGLLHQTKLPLGERHLMTKTKTELREL